MITVYYGPPGVGKTTVLARYAFCNFIRSKLHLPCYPRVFCNYPMKHTYQFSKKDFGVYDMSDSLILIDESSIDYNNRKFKDLPMSTIEHAKTARHYKEDIIMCSQAFNDTDVTFTRLATRYYLLRKSKIPNHIKALRITKAADIDKDTHQPIDGYTFDFWLLRLFTTRRFYAPLYWHMFDSWECKKLPTKKFKYNA